MKKTLLFLLMLLSAHVLMAQRANDQYVHCIVLDKTMSMIGHGGTDIWSDVQNYCYDWIDGVPESSIISFFTFDRSLYGPQVFVINSDADRKKAKDAVRNVVVDGKQTWISHNLDQAIEYVYENHSGKNKMVYLITDGIEEQPESNFSAVLRKYGSKRGDYDHLYYVDLRDLADDATKQAIELTEGASIGTGFVKFVTVRPVVQEMNYIVGKSRQLEQHFVVTNGEMGRGLTFNVRIDSIVNVGEGKGTANVVISPTANIPIEKMTETETGNYKMMFAMDYLNNSDRECDVFVSLVGSTQGDNVLIFEPACFRIAARNKEKPKVSVKVKKGFEE